MAISAYDSIRFDRRAQINTKNFMGTGGLVAAAFAELLGTVWSGRAKTVTPTGFKEELGRVWAPAAGQSICMHFNVQISTRGFCV